jgi:hypothetical protein
VEDERKKKKDKSPAYSRRSWNGEAGTNLAIPQGLQ